MKDKVFRGFIVAASLAMVLVIYGTYAPNMTIVIVSEALGLIAAAVGWLGFVRDLKRDAVGRGSNVQ